MFKLFIVLAIVAYVEISLAATNTSKAPAKLTTAELADVDAWVAKKVKSGKMTKKQADSAMKHPESLKPVMDSEKKPVKKGAK